MTAPETAGQAPPSADELLKRAADALWGMAKAALTVEHSLDKPYDDDPRWSPWTRWVERPAREAHDAAMAIRKHLRTTGAIAAAAPAPAGEADEMLGGILRDILESLCRRDGLPLESTIEPGEPARNYELAERLGIGHVFGLPDTAAPAPAGEPGELAVELRALAAAEALEADR